MKSYLPVPWNTIIHLRSPLQGYCAEYRGRYFEMFPLDGKYVAVETVEAKRHFEHTDANEPTKRCKRVHKDALHALYQAWERL